ncbi:Y-family DNA polymerase [Flavobacterium pallidum]|uniref:SOS mutagenesis and repair protein UmuC n=1 Tax=Flavobacterium pallidum TaxID=2172098 RepID=A0A2S1SFZ3_9FLAO|nr:Y-family DNA polymerase [Flavobacterium pallidum]AWI25333.1 SOS mutagenesis and repair protein UmuC [Flavobacterium pallidum]
MYALVDCNNFYASCERLFRPDLEGKPIVVLSNNDGCIISRSDEAKALGIAMGAPEFKVRDELKEKGINVFSSNYPLYGDLSERVMDILREFTPDVEVYSIDEAFLNFDKVKVADFHDYGLQMKSKIRRGLSIPVCVGIAPTKALSKVANKIARKFPDQTQGVHVIDSEKKRIKALKWTAIESVWGIGYRMKKKMVARNIKTAYDFTDVMHEAWIKSQMGVVGLRLRKELLGESVLELEKEDVKKRSIAITRSFPKKLTDLEPLRERVATFAAVCAEKLRKQESCCYTVIVLLGTLEHKTAHSKMYYQEASTLAFATNSTLTITNIALDLLEKIYEKHHGHRFHKAGVIVTQMIREDEKQFNLFEEEDPRHLSIMKAMDSLNKKIGERKVRLASQDEKTWNMKQELRSPRYTTSINELMVVKCH